MINKAQAIASLKPEAEFVVRGDELEWLSPDIDKPTEAEIDAEVKRLQTEYDAQEYARNRKIEYPSMEDQLDYMFHNGFDKWKEDIVQPVKDKYPKPE